MLLKLLRARPALDRFQCQEIGIVAIRNVVQRIGRIVRPVHDLAFDRLAAIPIPARRQFRRKFLVAQRPVQKRLLRVVEKVMLRLRQFAVERFVFQRRIQKSPAWIHPPACAGKNRLGQHPQGLGISLESPPRTHQPVQRPLPGVAEGRMPDIMRQTGRLHQITINIEVRPQVGTAPPQRCTDAPADLRDLDAVGQTGPVEIIFP